MASRKVNDTTNSDEENFDCEMTAFESSLTHKLLETCAYTRRKTRWCQIVYDERRDGEIAMSSHLSSLWKESHIYKYMYYIFDDDNERMPVYVEIGANIHIGMKLSNENAAGDED